MKHFLLFIFLFTGLHAKAQTFYEHFNTDTFWQKMVLDPVGVIPEVGASDTAIVVASTRARQPGNLRFMSELRDRGIVRYYFIYTSGGKWHVHEVPSLSKALALLPSPDKDWVVYTEGMGKIFTSDADRGMRLAGQYGVHVLLLDYPSIRSIYKSLHNYRFAINSSRASYEDFVPVLDSFRILREQQKAGAGHLTLFFHSMGNNVMREIVRHNLLFLFNNSVWVDNLVLNAPCVPRRSHRIWVDKIHFARRIYIQFNPTDGTLKWARIAGFHQVLGEHAKGPLSRNAVYINFHALSGNGHSNFLSLYSRPPAPEVALQHYSILFHGGSIDFHDATRYGPGSYRRIGYDLLPASR